MILNEAEVVTTDTIYRGYVLADSLVTSRDVVASFHNSLTLLSAEMEGRSFGGGVLELVPSEISRLSIPFVPGFGAEIDHLDELARIAAGRDDDSVIEETDMLLIKADIGLSQSMVDQVHDARIQLLNRRLLRNEAA
jgi:hypothetical protein